MVCAIEALPLVLMIAVEGRGVVGRGVSGMTWGGTGGVVARWGSCVVRLVAACLCERRIRAGAWSSAQLDVAMVTDGRGRERSVGLLAMGHRLCGDDTDGGGGSDPDRGAVWWTSIATLRNGGGSGGPVGSSEGGATSGCICCTANCVGIGVDAVKTTGAGVGAGAEIGGTGGGAGTDAAGSRPRGILATAREMARAVVLSYSDVRVRVWCWPGAGRGTHADTALDMPSIVVRCTRFDKVRQ